MTRYVAVYRSMALCLAVALTLCLAFQFEAADDLRRGQSRSSAVIAAGVENDLDSSRFAYNSTNQNGIAAPPIAPASSWFGADISFAIALRKIYRLNAVFLI